MYVDVQSDPTDRHVEKPILHKNDSKNSINKKRTASTSSSASSDSSVGHQTLLYSNKTFVTCRAPSNSFFLCRILQNVYHSTKNIRICWYSPTEGDDEANIDENTRFKVDYKDVLHPETILMEILNVTHHLDKTISLQKHDILKTNRLLKKSIKGELGSDETTRTSRSTIRKRRRINSSEAARKRSFSSYISVGISLHLAIRKRRRTKEIDDENGEKKEPAPTKRTGLSTINYLSLHQKCFLGRKTGVISKARLFKVQSNRFLTENPTVPEYEVEPFFEDK